MLVNGKSGTQKAENHVRLFAFWTAGLWHFAQTRGGLSPCSDVMRVSQPRLAERVGRLSVLQIRAVRTQSY